MKNMANRGTILLVLLLGLLQGSILAQAQPTLKTKQYRIGLFIPLYLDSAFDQQNNYRYPTKSFPKFLTPGIELYEGAMLALDSLNQLKAPLELVVVDTRATSKNLSQQLQSPPVKNLDLIITHCTTAELQEIASVGLQNNTPVVNVNLPNDGGITNNPFLVLLNSTLQTQSLAISNYALTKMPKQSVVVFRKKGVLEDRIRSYWDEAAKTNKAMQKWTYVDLPDSFTVQQLIPKLDTGKTTLCIAGSLDESFGKRLALQLAALSKQRYGATLLGMPTWDALKEFSNPEFRGIDIIYCTPYYNPRTDSLSQQLQRFFLNNLYARPSDMAYRGYEAVWRFANLILKYGPTAASQFTTKQFDLFREVQLQPVLGSQKQVHYFENKKLYFLKWQDGLLKLLP
jgi:ABC-type branched-subunit amino acid transport system substrate-binding protein